MKRSSRRSHRPLSVPALAAAAIVVATPLSAQQQGRDLLTREEPARLEGVVKQAVGDMGFHDAVGGHIDLVHAAASEPSERPDPTGVASAATTEYRYDDGRFERFTFLRNQANQPVHEQEYAQRFRLNGSGTVVDVVMCVARDEDRGNSSRLPFTLTFYRDSGGRPGSRLASVNGDVTIDTPGQGGCASLDLSSSAFRLGSGNTWIGIAWRNSSGMLMAEDTNGPGGTRTVYRARGSSSASWSSWMNDSVTYGIRLTVDHGGGTPPPPDPDPDPDPDPPPTTGCTPTTTALRFDGGYDVSMCYRTPQGTVGQAKAGVWSSSQAGILWFFDRENAEVLVKVLDGCAHNGHRWAFVAPVTDLEFNLRITGPGNSRWTHSNTQGRTAATKSDNRAFQCSNEGGDDDDDGGDGDGGDGGDGDGGGGDGGDGGGGDGGDGGGGDGGDGGDGTRYTVGDVITTLPTGSWIGNVQRLTGQGCSVAVSGGVTTVECFRNSAVERGAYRYTCDASRCGIRGRTVTEGAWIETRR